nr:MAG TPA: hypothetical protein [Caudoviricetes sp.]
MDKEKENLLYRPILEPSKYYKSDADIEHLIEDIPEASPFEEEPEFDERPKEIQESLESIEDLVKRALPPQLRFFGETIEKLHKRSKIVWKNGKIPDRKKEEYKPPEYKSKEPFRKREITRDKYSVTKDVPSLFPSAPPVNIKLEIPRTLVQLIQDDYNRDQIELGQYYTHQIRIIMQKYFQQMLTTMADCGLSDMNDLTDDFDGDYVNVPKGKNLEHLRDGVVRSQIIRNQKIRLFKKTHSVDNTLMHLRSWHAAEQQRERYYQEKYGDSGTYIDSHSNALLREARADYDSAYKSSLYDMYKYLNSSAVNLGDILNMTVKEAQAKGAMLKAGVDIFDKTPVELNAEAGGIAGNSGQAGDGSGSGFDLAAGTQKSPSSLTEGSSNDKDNKEEKSNNTASTNESEPKGKELFSSLEEGIGKKIGKGKYGDLARDLIHEQLNKGIKAGGLNISNSGISYKGISYDGEKLNINGNKFSRKNGKISAEFNNGIGISDKGISYKGYNLSKSGLEKDGESVLSSNKVKEALQKRKETRAKKKELEKEKIKTRLAELNSEKASLDPKEPNENKRIKSIDKEIKRLTNKYERWEEPDD